MTKSAYLKSTPIFLAFLVMGFGDVSGPLTSQLQSCLGLMAGFIVPALCMTYILYIAFRTSKA